MSNSIPRRVRRSRSAVSAVPEPADVKPFAVQLAESGNINQQHQSPLFTSMPKEMRDLIFEYASLAYPDPDRPYSNKERYVRPGACGHPRIAVELLLTCKAAYVEAYQLPITLNPIVIYYDNASHIPPHARSGINKLKALHPWQRAALHMVDISLQQIHLEGSVIQRTAVQLDADRRYGLSRAFNAARGHNGPPRPTRMPSGSSNLTTPDSQAQRLSGLEMPSASYNMPRVIWRLTLRLGRTQWWTWEDTPPHPHAHLAIDPGHGNVWFGDRCTTALMIAEANKRRKGEWTGWATPRCWGAQVADFKGLRELELIFETFKLKEKQLDTVLDCAMTWSFPMEDGYELAWDGKVEKDSWMGVDDYGYEERNAWLREHEALPASAGERTEEEVREAGQARKKFIEENPLPDYRLFVVRTIRYSRRRCSP